MKCTTLIHTSMYTIQWYAHNIHILNTTVHDDVLLSCGTFRSIIHVCILLVHASDVRVCMHYSTFIPSVITLIDCYHGCVFDTQVIRMLVYELMQLTCCVHMCVCISLSYCVCVGITQYRPCMIHTLFTVECKHSCTIRMYTHSVAALSLSACVCVLHGSS